MLAMLVGIAMHGFAACLMLVGNPLTESLSYRLLLQLVAIVLQPLQVAQLLLQPPLPALQDAQLALQDLLYNARFSLLGERLFAQVAGDQTRLGDLALMRLLDRLAHLIRSTCC